MSDLTAVSLFAGVGGFDLALQRAGVDVVAAVEIDPAARGVLADRFPHTALYNDVTEVTGDQLRAAGFVPERGILTGGFPCQDLSVAGRRAGLGGARSGLFWEIDRLLAELRPAWVVLENVPGLLSSHGGRDMGAVLGAMGDRGYGYAWRILDAQYWGVPQRRRRVFIAGCLGDWAAPAQVLLEPESGGGDPSAGRRSGEDVAGTLGGGSGSRGWAADTERMTFVPTTARTRSTSNQRIDGDTETFVTYQKVVRSGERDADGGLPPDVWVARDVSATLNPHDLGSGTRAVDVVVKPTAFHLTQEPINGPVVPALSGGGTGQGVHAASAVRRLTPMECERLQGFPDGWTLTSNGRPQADSARYRQMGNAVAVPVVEWIVRRIVAARPDG